MIIHVCAARLWWFVWTESHFQTKLTCTPAVWLFTRVSSRLWSSSSREWICCRSLLGWTTCSAGGSPPSRLTQSLRPAWDTRGCSNGQKISPLIILTTEHVLSVIKWNIREENSRYLSGRTVHTLQRTAGISQRAWCSHSPGDFLGAAPLNEQKRGVSAAAAGLLLTVKTNRAAGFIWVRVWARHHSHFPFRIWRLTTILMRLSSLGSSSVVACRCHRAPPLWDHTRGLLRSLEAMRPREEPWTWKQGARGPLTSPPTLFEDTWGGTKRGSADPRVTPYGTPNKLYKLYDLS